jgi:hypothetical protein
LKTNRYTAGDRVIVRPLAEILATLDDDGRLNALPFMPEMIEHCGREYVVAKTAHKTCDTVNRTGGRQLRSVVHLDNLRCSGSAHGGCDAECLLFWHEAWLKPASPESVSGQVSSPPSAQPLPTRWHASIEEGVVRYRCQATDLPLFTRLLPWWDVRQYVKDVASGNVSLRRLIADGFMKLLQNLAGLGVGYRFIARFYAFIQRRRGLPSLDAAGALPSGTRTPIEHLGLKVGDMVEVKSFEEIKATIDIDGKNRGMRFDFEMKPHCGKRYRVAKIVNRLIDERSGALISMKTTAVILDGVYCQSRYSHYRMFCPRGIPAFWREIWLRRVDEIVPVRIVSKPEQTTIS